MNKSILITGGTSGIGFSIAKALAQQGNQKLILNYCQNDEKALEAQQQLLKIEPSNQVYLVKEYLRDRTSVEKLFSQVQTTIQGDSVSKLILAHGHVESKLFVEKSLEETQQTIQEHLVTSVLLTRLFLPIMLKFKLGRFLYITSVASRWINRGQADYALSKAALEAFVKNLASENHTRNTTFNCLSVGFAENNFKKEKFKNLNNKNKILPVELEQVAEMACMILSEKSKNINGATFSIDSAQAYIHTKSPEQI